MKVIVLGLLFCEKSLAAALKNSTCGIQYAPHKFQSNLISGLEQQPGVDLHVINLPPTGSFPIHSKELYSRQYDWAPQRMQLSYWNLPFVKHVEQAHKLYAACSSLLKDTDEPAYVVIYSPYPPFLQVCNRLKTRFPHVRCCLILTDPIPGRGDLARFMTPRAQKKGDAIIAQTACMDSFVVLTEHLADSVEVGERPYTIVECICNEHQEPAAPTEVGKQKTVLYAGTLEKEYGILDMAEAFTYLPDATFRIYGRGNAEDELKVLSATHSNIEYCGFADQTVIRQEQDACSFLINPRRPTGTFTRYSFPSKTAEYMMSGKPVIMYKLEGVPDEYDPYLNYLTACEPSAIAQELAVLFARPYTSLLEKAEKGRQFMQTHKSAAAQAAKIVALLNELP
ncbi:MAG: glycosyltransferase [Clostridia bacterium]|nr:glycosyltransferase [Clostridia bacterium]